MTVHNMTWDIPPFVAQKIRYPSASGTFRHKPKPLRTLVRKLRPSGRPRGTSPQKDSCEHSGSGVQKTAAHQGCITQLSPKQFLHHLTSMDQWNLCSTNRDFHGFHPWKKYIQLLVKSPTSPICSIFTSFGHSNGYGSKLSSPKMGWWILKIDLNLWSPRS